MFLIDQNLPPSLARVLSRVAPARHVRSLDLQQANDSAIWRYCEEQGCIVVTKDDDFQELAMLSRPESGARVIWLRVGNRSVSRVMTLVESRLDDIAWFVAAERSKILVIAEPRTA